MLADCAGGQGLTSYAKDNYNYIWDYICRLYKFQVPRRVYLRIPYLVGYLLVGNDY
jgi:hypothetical protein